MSMEYIPSSLPGVGLYSADRTVDHRGSFERVWSFDALTADAPGAILQASAARNPVCGTLRGLHFAVAPQTETKYVRCLQGAIFDVVVDLRPHSSTCGQAVAFTLAETDSQTLQIPPGCAHGYQTLKDNTLVLYLMNRPYLAAAAHILRFDAPELQIPWPLSPTALSQPDRTGLSLPAALALVKGAADARVQ